MQRNKTWDDVAHYYLSIKKIQQNGQGIAGIAPILRSRTLLKPELTIEVVDKAARIARIVGPDNQSAAAISLFDALGSPIPFSSVPEIRAVIPSIGGHLPFNVQSDLR